MKTMGILLLALVVGGCSSSPDILGKWRTRDGGEHLEFLADGTVVARGGAAGQWHKSSDGFVVTYPVFGSTMTEQLRMDGQYLIESKGDGAETCLLRYSSGEGGTETMTEVTGGFGSSEKPAACG